MRRIPLTMLAIATATLLSPGAWAQQVRRLYPGTAPGSETWTHAEINQPISGGMAYTNVRDPELTSYLPKGQPNGTAAILLPGGGLRGLSIGRENQDLIRLFTEHGVTVFVLKYRTLQIDAVPARRPSGAPIKFPKLAIRNANANPSPGDARLNEVLKLATQDLQTAMWMINADAAKLHIDPKRIGFVGSSAGGGVAFSTLLAREAGTTPAFIVSLYGPSLQDVTVPTDAPPLFIATETAHGPVTDGLLALFSLWKDADRPAELHVFDIPNFEMPVALYSERLTAFLEKQGFLTR
jgi:acetyl esterase/lipase